MSSGARIHRLFAGKIRQPDSDTVEAAPFSHFKRKNAASCKQS